MKTLWITGLLALPKSQLVKQSLARESKDQAIQDTHIQGFHVSVELFFPELGQFGENRIVSHLTATCRIQPVREQVLCFLQQYLRERISTLELGFMQAHRKMAGANQRPEVQASLAGQDP